MAWIPPRPLLRAPLRSPPRPRARKQTVVVMALRRRPPLLPLRALQLEALLAQLRPSLPPPLRALQHEEEMLARRRLSPLLLRALQPEELLDPQLEALLALRQPPLPLLPPGVAQRQLTLLLLLLRALQLGALLALRQPSLLPLLPAL